VAPHDVLWTTDGRILFLLDVLLLPLLPRFHLLKPDMSVQFLVVFEVFFFVLLQGLEVLDLLPEIFQLLVFFIF
jgi:hypothetical protein